MRRLALLALAAGNAFGAPPRAPAPLPFVSVHPEVFSYVGVFSMDSPPMSATSWKPSGRLEFNSVGHSKVDPVVRVAQGKNLAAQLGKVGINYHNKESVGGLAWANWRIYFTEFATSLFK